MVLWRSPLKPHLDALGFLGDLGYSRYLERNVIQIQVVDPLNRFISCDGVIVYEFRLLRANSSCDLLYAFKLLHYVTIHRVPGVARIIGIVVDGTRQRLRACRPNHP